MFKDHKIIWEVIIVFILEANKPRDHVVHF